MEGLKNSLTGQPITDAEIKSLSDLIKTQVSLENQLEGLEKQVGEVSNRLRQISETTIPEAMLELGLSELKLDDGTKVTVKPFYQASIPGEFQEAAFEYLRSTGNGALIKRDVTCQFGMGDDAAAAKIVALLRTQGVEPKDKTYVHPMTLKAFVREKIESNQKFPRELFGVFEGKKTKLTPPK